MKKIHHPGTQFLWTIVFTLWIGSNLNDMSGYWSYRGFYEENHQSENTFPLRNHTFVHNLINILFLSVFCSCRDSWRKSTSWEHISLNICICVKNWIKLEQYVWILTSTPFWLRPEGSGMASSTWTRRYRITRSVANIRAGLIGFDGVSQFEQWLGQRLALKASPKLASLSHLHSRTGNELDRCLRNHC